MKLSEQIWKKNTFVVDISIHYTYIYHNNIIYQEPFNLQLREAFIKKTIFLLTFVNKRGGVWANTKKACKDRNLTNTGLYKHFHEGCPTHLETGDLSHLTYTLLDYIDTSEEQLRVAGHTGGVQCRCSECQRLKDTEDKWICRLGTFNAPFGLNSRDEIKSRVRVNFRQSRIGGTWENLHHKNLHHKICSWKFGFNFVSMCFLMSCLYVFSMCYNVQSPFHWGIYVIFDYLFLENASQSIVKCLRKD